MNNNIKSGQSHANEVKEGKRFKFGKNWKNFLSTLNDERIYNAELSLKEMLEVDSLEGKRFLDVGSGSGLFSLAARRLGAEVDSFDYDPQSVACASELKERYFPDDVRWKIKEGSVLDEDYMKSLGEYDVVYSWGVLHHTGEMWKALHNVQYPVKNNGVLFIGIYNDQGAKSVFWLRVKQLYCSGLIARLAVISLFVPGFILYSLLTDLLRLRNPFTRYTEYKKNRGMSIFYDWFDWLGGYPFEVATPEEIFDFHKKNMFQLKKLITNNGLGINEFIFKRTDVSNI